MTEIDQVPDDTQFFKAETYQSHITDPSVFKLPNAKCNVQNTCWFFSICTALRGRNIF